MNIRKYWRAIIERNAEEISNYFKDTAIIRWHNTNEQFTLEEFIKVNCEYPSNWDCEVERIEEIADLIITVTRVFATNSSVSVHATSFLRIEGEKIASLDEYWSDDGEAPKWRLDLKIGRRII
ncbi:MAG: nuclear transport factor 2 family protein [Fusobacterium sp.]|uniref:nuclear transport factor 2 family protein n=1 Tax=Fusobacterium sp. TaxID=68766 RepID=UPI0026DAFF92|nr:nuclear transport factor 2 family protein [Fusobacterium sp.]MDO4690094.1 nuclear transport factor 2 family protein [Fusobacterium sp.]